MRMVVDLPAPLGPRKPKISPARDLEADAVHGHERAEALLRSSDDDRVAIPARRRCGPASAQSPASAGRCLRDLLGQHRNEHVFQRGLDRAGCVAESRCRRRAAASLPPGASPRRAPASPRGRGRRTGRPTSAQPRRAAAAAAARGSRGADLQDRAAHEPLDLVRRADGQQPALVDQRQAVAALGLVEVGGGDEDRHPLAHSW